MAKSVDARWLLPAAALGLLVVWTRLVPLGAGLWYDEAYTAVAYVDAGPGAIFFGHYLPNNHVLFSLLSWATTGWLGTHESVYRLWSAVPAVVTVGLLVWWGAATRRPAVGLVAGFLVAFAPLHLDLGVQARGYGLGFLAGAGMLVCAERAWSRAGAPQARNRWLAGFAGSGLAGMATLPVMAPALVGHGAALMVHPRLRGPAAVATAGALGAGLLFLSPVLGGIIRASGQDFGAPLAWHGVLTGPPVDLVQPTVSFVVPGLPGALAGPSAALLVLGGALALWRAGERGLLLAAGAPLLVTYGVIGLARLHTHPRFTSFLLVHATVLAAAALVAAAELLGRVRALPVAVAAGALLVLVGAGRTVEQAGDLAATPREAYREAAVITSDTDLGAVLVNVRPGFRHGFRHYLDAPSFPDPGALAAALCEQDGPFVFIDYPLYGHPDADTTCAAQRGGQPVVLPQRAGSPEQWMRVYLVPG